MFSMLGEPFPCLKANAQPCDYYLFHLWQPASLMPNAPLSHSYNTCWPVRSRGAVLCGTRQAVNNDPLHHSIRLC